MFVYLCVWICGLIKKGYLPLAEVPVGLSPHLKVTQTDVWDYAVYFMRVHVDPGQMYTQWAL